MAPSTRFRDAARSRSSLGTAGRAGDCHGACPGRQVSCPEPRGTKLVAIRLGLAVAGQQREVAKSRSKPRSGRGSHPAGPAAAGGCGGIFAEANSKLDRRRARDQRNFCARAATPGAQGPGPQPPRSSSAGSSALRGGPAAPSAPAGPGHEAVSAASRQLGQPRLWRGASAAAAAAAASRRRGKGVSAAATGVVAVGGAAPMGRGHGG